MSDVTLKDIITSLRVVREAIQKLDSIPAFEDDLATEYFGLRRFADKLDRRLKEIETGKQDDGAAQDIIDFNFSECWKIDLPYGKSAMVSRLENNSFILSYHQGENPAYEHLVYLNDETRKLERRLRELAQLGTWEPFQLEDE